MTIAKKVIFIGLYFENCYTVGRINFCWSKLCKYLRIGYAEIYTMALIGRQEKIETWIIT